MGKGGGVGFAMSGKGSSAAAEVGPLDQFLGGAGDFVKDSLWFLRKCSKPDRREFAKVSFAVGMGFVVMGFIGFFVKLIFIPINQIILS